MVVWMNKSNNMIFGAPDALINQLNYNKAIRPYTGHSVEAVKKNKKNVHLKRRKKVVKNLNYLDGINHQIGSFKDHSQNGSMAQLPRIGSEKDSDKNLPAENVGSNH